MADDPKQTDAAAGRLALEKINALMNELQRQGLLKPGSIKLVNDTAALRAAATTRGEADDLE